MDLSGYQVQNSNPDVTPRSSALSSLPSPRVFLLLSLQNNPEKTAEVECGDFYNTGDRASVDEDGYFWFSGRGDDVINASG